MNVSFFFSSLSFAEQPLVNENFLDLVHRRRCCVFTTDNAFRCGQVVFVTYQCQWYERHGTHRTSRSGSFNCGLFVHHEEVMVVVMAAVMARVCA